MVNVAFKDQPRTIRINNCGAEIKIHDFNVMFNKTHNESFRLYVSSEFRTHLASLSKALMQSASHECVLIMRILDITSSSFLAKIHVKQLSHASQDEELLE